MTVALPMGQRVAGAGGLAPFGVFAACLAMAGLPLYIHAPMVFAETHGVSLTALGTVLFALRFVDVVQDPLLGRLAETLRDWRSASVSVAMVAMAAGMFGLFAVTPPVAPLLWFAAMLLPIFTGYSFLTICFYAQGVARAEAMGKKGHIRLARWRETGALIGVCLAAMAPTVLAEVSAQPYAVFALGFAACAGLALVAMRKEWQADHLPAPTGFAIILQDRTARRLLIVGLLNAAPVAVTATLFLYFVESRLAAPALAGPFLLVFFLSAALAAPLWSKLAEYHGARAMLLWGMALSVVSFAAVLTLGAGDIAAFALVCVASGAALGADLSLLPALFAARMARVSPSAAEGFGLWAFMSKFALALAAAILLPLLDLSGFTAGGANTEKALTVLTLLYACLPCLLKLGAIFLLVQTELED